MHRPPIDAARGSTCLLLALVAVDVDVLGEEDRVGEHRESKTGVGDIDSASKSLDRSRRPEVSSAELLGQRDAQQAEIARAVGTGRG